MFSKRVLSIVAVALISVLFVALVGARGSIGFSRGSMKADGEVSGKMNEKSGMITMKVEKHPNASSMQAFYQCKNGPGHIVNGHTGAVEQVISASTPINKLDRKKGTVKISGNDLVATFNTSNGLCPPGNGWTVEAWPVGAFVTVEVKDGNDVDQRFEYLCGSYLGGNGEPVGQVFTNGGPFSGSDYACTEISDQTNP